MYWYSVLLPDRQHSTTCPSVNRFPWCPRARPRLRTTLLKSNATLDVCDVVSLTSTRVHNLRQLVFRADLNLRQEDSLWRSPTSLRGLIVVVSSGAPINIKQSRPLCRASQAPEVM